MLNQPGQTRLLTQHFFRRLLDNDLVGPDEDLHGPIAAILAVLLSTGGGVSAIFYFKYNPNPPLPLDVKLAMAVDEKVLLVGGAMILMALLTLLAWDALSLERRDVAVLAPLPVRTRSLLASKTASLAAMAAAFAIALGVPPAILFPSVMLMDQRVGLGYGLRAMGAQAAAAMLGCAFVFLSLVTLRNLASLVLPARPARRLLAVAQGLLIPVLLAVLLMMPALAMLTRPAVEAESRAALGWPPLWFLGINEALIGRATPLLRELATTGLLALLGSALAAAATYLLAFRRDLLALRGHASERGNPAAAGRLLAIAGTVLVRDPLARGTYAFTAMTLVRSARHRLYLAGYVGAGGALACASLAGAGGRWDPAMFDLGPVALAVQYHLLLCLLVGVRVAAAVPAELRAAWMFRVCATASLSRYLAGSRAAVFVLGVVPLLLLLAPAHALLWGWPAAAVHAAWGLGFALAAWTLLFRRFDRLPFACAAAPGRTKLTSRLALYVIGYILAVNVPAALESFLILRPGLAVLWVALTVFSVARLVVWGHGRPRSDRVPSFEARAGEFQRLGLDQG